MPGNELERKGKHLKPNYSFEIAYVLYLLDNSIVYGVYFPMIFQSLFLNKKKIWLCHMVCGISVPRPGIEPPPCGLEVWTLNHWTPREVLPYDFLKCIVSYALVDM